MELVSCKNCCAVYGDVQDECPTCGADALGHGAEVELDGATRNAVRSLGGTYGGILAGPQPGAHYLWCESGVCLYEEERGLVWKAELWSRIDDVSPRKQTVRVKIGRIEVLLDPEDGSRVV